MKDYDFSQMEQQFQSIYNSMTFNNDLSDEREEEEERKKKEELDGQAFIHMKEKAEEYAQQPFGPDIKLDDAKSIFRPTTVYNYVEVDLDNDINAEFAKDSIGITIAGGNLTPAGRERAADMHGNLTKDEQIICSSLTMLDTFSDRAKTLARFKEQLLATQKYPKANTPGGGKEGPEDYRNLLSAIDQYIALDAKKMNGDVSLDQLSKKFSEVNTLGTKYLISHKPNIVGHKSAQTEERYNIIGNLVDDGRVKRDVIHKNILSINKNMKNSEKGLAFDNLGAVKVAELAPRVYQQFKSDTGRNMEDYIVMSKYNKDFQTMSGRSRMYRSDVLNNLRRATRTNSAISIDDYAYNNKPIMKPGKYSSYDYAQAYLAKKHIDALNKNGVTYSDAKEIRRQTDPAEFNRQVRELSAKPAFQALKGFRPSTVLNDWGLVEAHADKKWREYQNNYMKLHSGSMDKTIAALKQEHSVMDQQLILQLAYTSIMADSNNKELIETLYTLNGLGFKSDAKLVDRQINNAILKQLRQSGIMDELLNQPIEDLPKLLEKLNDPKIHKALSKATKSAAQNSFKKSVNRNREAQKKNTRVRNNHTRVERQTPQARGPHM